MRWFLTSQLIRQRSNVSEWLQSHQRAVLLACTVIAVGAFARFEVQILASGTPTWWAWSDQGKYLSPLELSLPATLPQQGTLIRSVMHYWLRRLSTCFASILLSSSTSCAWSAPYGHSSGSARYLVFRA